MLPVLILLLPAAFEFSPPAGLAGAMQAGTAVVDPSNAVALNPALLAEPDRRSLALTFTQPYGLEGLTFSRFAIALPRPRVGARLSVLNFPGYQEFTGSVAKAFALGSGFSVGAAADVFMLAIAREQFDVVPAVNAGALWRSRYLNLGASLRNLNRAALPAGDFLPTSLSLGTCVMPVSNLRLSGDFEYSDQARLRFGAAFDVNSWLGLAAGISTNPLLCSGGFRVAARGLGISYTYAFQPQLKDSHVFELGYRF